MKFKKFIIPMQFFAGGADSSTGNESAPDASGAETGGGDPKPSTSDSEQTEKTFTQEGVDRIVAVNSGADCVLNASGGTYEFKYEISTNRLSVYAADKAVDCIGDCNDDGLFNVVDIVLFQNWLLAVPNVKLPKRMF